MGVQSQSPFKLLLCRARLYARPHRQQEACQCGLNVGTSHWETSWFKIPTVRERFSEALTRLSKPSPSEFPPKLGFRVPNALFLEVFGAQKPSEYEVFGGRPGKVSTLNMPSEPLGARRAPEAGANAGVGAATHSDPQSVSYEN